MSKGNPSYLRFSLEESVWFQRGQEVLDLLSISLDPDILIQEDEQYVTIQGALELTGEYKRNEVEIEEEDVFSAQKFIQIVEEREEGICEFNHFFPVDITIPKNRIEKIEDIDVKVESFDYVFPERSCLKLTANVLISGLYGDQQHSVADEEEEVEEVEEEEYHEVRIDLVSEEDLEEEPIEEPEEEPKEELYQPFKVEARKQPEKAEEKVLSPVVSNEAKVEDMAEKLAEEPIEVKGPIPSIRNEESSSSPLDVFAMPIPESTSEVESSSIVVKEITHEQEEESPKKEEKQKKKSNKKSMSLTEFFARKEVDEVAKLKVCIVQNGDTVDLIAERYNIPVLQLLRVNQLEMNQDIKEGQVLYIPVPVVR